MDPSQSPEFIILDHWPQSRIESAWIFAKIFVKEGLLRNSWRGVRTYGRTFGSTRIPDGLSESLRQLDAPFLRNSFSNSAETVVAFKDVRCLRWALAKKKHGKIQKLLAGPFIATLPFEYDTILLDPAIDGLIFLSAWHRDMFLREAKRPTPQTFIWPAGVDPNFWSPISGAKKDQVLVYVKEVDPELEEYVLKSLGERELKYSVLHYGKYTPEQYRDELRKSRFCIFLHKSETQGLSTFESWSCDVPTLHAETGTMDFLGKLYQGASSSPYLTSSCGLNFRTQKEFDVAVDKMLSQLPSFSTREFILGAHTQLEAAERFVQLLKDA